MSDDSAATEAASPSESTDDHRGSHEITIPLTHIKLAGQNWPAEAEASEKLPVLALHGWLDNAASFRRLIPLLPKDRRFVALDLPGHGLSEHRPAGSYGYFMDYVPFVFEAADALGWERFVLMGHSMGAGIGTLAAGTFPDRVAGLILIDGMGPLTESDEGAPARFRSFLQSVRRAQKSEARDRGAAPGDSSSAAAVTNTGGGSVYSSEDHAVRARKLVGGLSDASARLLVQRNLMQRLDGQGAVDGFIWRTDARLKLPSPMRLTEKQVRAFLSEIEAPTLMLAALDSEFAAYENLIQARAGSIRDLSTKKLSGGHHLHMENPEPVAQAIAEFLGRV
ncbi:MAG: alpha/beta hydrolase [bacterium]|nr:alpha/beta hydrolase [bacterium]